MAWISLAATRYELADALRHNLGDAGGPPPVKVVSALEGRDALLAGDERQIARQIERAEDLLRPHLEGGKPPHSAVMAQVLGLAVVAGLGGGDYSAIFERIAAAKFYKGKWELSLQLLARRITGLAESPSRPYRRRGHVGEEGQWYRLVTDAPTAHSFNLAVTPDHPGWYIIGGYVLPLAYLLSKEQGRAGDSEYLRRLLRWGGPDPERAAGVIYERKAAPPAAGARGFDAVEIRGDELFAYYYLGVGRRDPPRDDEGGGYEFLGNVADDWREVEAAVTDERRAAVAGLREQGRCTCVVVYDGARAAPAFEESAAAAERHGVRLVARDFTEV